jgi:hypothetical protein
VNRVVTIDDTAIPEGVIHIVEQLPDPDDLQPGDTVTLRFKRVFIYMTGLVLLAAWRKALPASVQVLLDDSLASPETQRYLANTGFKEVIETGIYHPSVPSRIGKVPIQAILRGREKEATVNEIVRIFDDYAGQVKDSSPFRVLLSELCENVLSHSELTTPGYICARVLEHINKCEIAIADTGIGIEQSFRMGTNRAALERIAKGESAATIAIEGMSSSKPEPGPGIFRTYFGFGLFITRRLIEENRGRLVILSGHDAITIERYTKTKSRLSRPWHGTFIGLVLDLANPLPLEHVYAEAHSMIGPVDAPAAVAVAPTVASSAPPKTKDASEEPAAIVVKDPEKKQETPSVIEAVTLVEPEEHTLQLSHYGTQLLTREMGTAIRADLASQLAAGRHVGVRLDGIEDITPSCVDEAFGKLSEIIGFETFGARVRFDGGQPIVNTLIQFVLKTRQRSS